jgi:hypothetical protein
MELINDPYVEAVISLMRKRSQEGILKYGTTLARQDINFIDWLIHLQEELMDASLYDQRLKDFADSCSPEFLSWLEEMQVQLFKGIVYLEKMRQEEVDRGIDAKRHSR